MGDCPNCHAELAKPPEDLREWFRCDKCGVPLEFPSGFAKLLYWASLLGVFALAVVIQEVAGKYFPGREFFIYLADGCFLVVYGALARMFWKTKLSRPHLFDPYSSLNLSDSRKKLRGRG
jgi:hypothetical protein